MAVGALIVLPALFWTGLPAPASWPWILASTSINIVTLLALLRAYAISGFGVSYPTVRALSVLLVVPLAARFAGEHLSAMGLVGMGLVGASLLLIAFGDAKRGGVPRAALVWIAAAGAGTAAYVLCDAQGVRSSGLPLAYGFVVSICNAVAMLALNSATSSWRHVARHAVVATPIAIASMTSYLLILWVWSQAPIAPSAALRDTSAVFALIIAIVWLKEPFTPLRLFAILLSAAAVPLLRLA